jgi:transposase-like protein
MATQFTEGGICVMSSIPTDLPSIPSPRERRVVRKRSAEERRRLLALFERSGQTLKQFCLEHDVALSSLTFWRSQARRRVAEKRSGALVEVPATVVTSTALVRPESFVPGSVEVRLPNRIELSVSVGANSVWVGELLRELLTCSG